MFHYRMFFISSDDSIMGVWEIESICDETAISAATRKAGGQLFELWNQDRLVFRHNRIPVDVC